MSDLSAVADPAPSWPSYRVYFAPSSNPIPTLDVISVRSLSDQALLDAVLAHVRPRWPGATLEVRVNRSLMRGRVFAGGARGRRVAAFTLVEHGPDGAVPPPPTHVPGQNVGDGVEGTAGRP